MIVKHCAVESGDWEAIYVDGKLVEQGHSIPVWMLLESPLFVAGVVNCGGVFVYDRVTFSDAVVEEKGCSFPETVEELATWNCSYPG